MNSGDKIEKGRRNKLQKERKRSFDEAAKTTCSEQCGGEPVKKEEEQKLRRRRRRKKERLEERRRRKEEREREDERDERCCSSKVGLFEASNQNKFYKSKKELKILIIDREAPLRLALFYLGIAQMAIAPPPRTQTGTLGHFFQG